MMAAKATQGSVHVFEPIPVNAALINASVQINSFKNVTGNNVAVGKEEGEATFSVSADSAYSSIIATGRLAEAVNIKVPVLSLDEYVRKNKIDRVDVIKVDVEGAEGLVIEGAKGLLNSKQKPRLVLLELFDQNLKPFDFNVAQIIKKMKDFGYAPHVANQDGTLKPFPDEMINIAFNIIFTPI